MRRRRRGGEEEEKKKKKTKKKKEQKKKKNETMMKRKDGQTCRSGRASSRLCVCFVVFLHFYTSLTIPGRVQ